MSSTRGRKELPNDQKRKHHTGCKLTDAELLILNQRRGRMPVGTYIRIAALSKPPAQIPAINTDALSELRRIGTNLNQLAHSSNSGIRLNKEKLFALLDKLDATADQMLGIRE